MAAAAVELDAAVVGMEEGEAAADEQMQQQRQQEQQQQGGRGAPARQEDADPDPAVWGPPVAPPDNMEPARPWFSEPCIMGIGGWGPV
jgi:hypothetical protein